MTNDHTFHHDPVTPKFKTYTLKELMGEFMDEQLDHLNMRNRFLAAAAANDDPVQIIRQFGTWAVTDYGLEYLEHYGWYEIEKARLPESSNQGTLEWLIHLSEKNWVKLADLIPAYQFAMCHHYPGRRFVWSNGLDPVAP